jgi:hypothetical protein
MKPKLVIAAGILAVSALLGAVALACVPQATIRNSPANGEAGTRVTVTGSTFDPAGSPVKIWWDGTRGTQLASVPVQADRTFTYSFNVPTGAPGGTHLVSATQQDAQGQSYNPVNATFTVTGAPKQATAPNLQGPARQQNVTAAAPASQPAPAPAAQQSAQSASGQAPAVASAQSASPPAPPAAGPVGSPPPPASPVADGSTQPVTASDAFRTPALTPDASAAGAPGSDGAPAWAVGGLAALALGLLGAGTGIFVTERRRARVPAEAESS